MYPVQRKSDGKLGFYDITENQFYSDLVSGSDSNTLTAGPTVDENFDTETDPTYKQGYSNPSGFVVPKNNVVNDTTTIMTLDNDVDYITVSAHLYHQAVGAYTPNSANIYVNSLYGTGSGYNRAVSNTDTTAKAVDINNYRLEIQHSGTLIDVYAYGYLNSVDRGSAYVRLIYDASTRELKCERYGVSGVKTRIEISNIKIEAHTAY